MAAVCTRLGCGLKATFGSRGLRAPTRCLAHRAPWHQSITAPLAPPAPPAPPAPLAPPAAARLAKAPPGAGSAWCLAPSCGARATHGVDGTGPTKRYCAAHSRAAAGPLTCVPGCDTRPSFGPPGQVACRCLGHAAEGMLRLPHVLCAHCPRPGTWAQGFASLARRCDLHRRPTDLALVLGTCRARRRAMRQHLARRHAKAARRHAAAAAAPVIPFCLQDPLPDEEFAALLCAQF